MNCPQCNRPLISLMEDCLFCALQDQISGWPAQSVSTRSNLCIEHEALKAELDSQFPETNSDLRLGREQVRIPEMLTYRNLSLSGVDATGKTEAIDSLLQQLRAMSNQKCLIVDVNGSYYSRFGQPGDLVLSLSHEQSEAWEFYNEEATPEFFAEALVEPDRSNGLLSADTQALVTDLLKLNNSAEGLWRDVTSSLEQLLERVKGKRSSAFLGDPEYADAVLARAIVSLNFLQHLASSNQERELFSLIQWATSPSNDWVFLIVPVYELAKFSPLLRLWFELAIVGVLERDPSSNYPHLWLIADDLASLGKLPSLGILLAQTRKYKASLVASYQISAQLENVYGRAGAEAIFDSFHNKIHFRNPCPDAAFELGLPISEVQSLPDLQAYLTLCNFAPTRIQFDV